MNVEAGRLIVGEEAQAPQRAASDPTASAWVTAHAGSGKTHVLVQRVVRLMLAGSAPGAILCLTFTKAAAATMANRVFDLIGQWTRFSDAELDAALAEIDGKPPGASRRARARRLFAEALETPGGLKVQTIHAFCERLLHQFPFEANVRAQFQVLDDRSAKELAEAAKIEVLEQAAAAPDAPIGRAMGRLAGDLADRSVSDLLDHALAARDKLIAAAPDGDVAAYARRLARRLGLQPGEDRAAIDAATLESAAALRRAVAAIAGARKKGKIDDKIAALFALALAGDAEGYRDGWLKGDGEMRVDLKFGKEMLGAEPWLADFLDAEKARVAGLIDKARALDAVEATSAVFTVAQAVIAAMERRKALSGALGFDDLIAKAGALMEKGAAGWVLYKLDQGVDHILVDEAQDTSPAQWRLIAKLVEEFRAGEGAREVRRTLFVVGDEKQSIYSFQGADPVWFDQMRRQFLGDFTRAGRVFDEPLLQHSFRSAPDLLAAVDHVFADGANRRGLSADDVGPVHKAIRRNAPGMVEIWPLVPCAADDKPPAFDAPLDQPGLNAAPGVLARRIARNAALWLSGPEPLRPSEILILVRKRGPLFEAIIRALKQRGLPVAGADRMTLTAHVAVQDLMALGEAALTLQDDLSVATLLKSPFFGATDDDLLRLCPGRPGSLFDALKAEGHPAAPRLQRWAREAASLSPAAFYAGVLARDGGRRAILARLGREAMDAVDEFMKRAFDHERRAMPTLPAFLQSLRTADVEVKRDMDLAREEIRVMTVHGAKGLEAGLVVLADTTSPPGGSKDTPLLTLPPRDEPVGAADLVVWSPRAAGETSVAALARAARKAAQEAEYRRLLYVAMTRARDTLVVCGAEPKRKSKASEVWYDMVARSLIGGEVARPALAEDGEGEVWRVGGGRPGAPKGERVDAAPATRPDYLDRPAPRPAARETALAPTALAAVGGGPAGGGSDMVRGRLAHRLLQALPEVAPARRRAAALAFLARHSLDPADPLVENCLTLLAHPRLAALFGPGAKAEATIAGRLGGVLVAGRVDRMAITAEGVEIVDFKTGAMAELAPESYVGQLSIYAALLGAMAPGRRVTAMLAYVDAGTVVELTPEALARGLPPLS